MMSSTPGMHTTSISPFCDARLSSVSNKSMSVSSDGDPRAQKARKLLPDGHAQLQLEIAQRSDESDDSDDELFPEIDMEALRQRGKGNYSCPKSYQCKKGGVDKEGNLVIFDRNSSFAYVVTADPIQRKHLRDAVWRPCPRQRHAICLRLLTKQNRQHCNKHRKPWRCDIPGCPNPPKKRRFARRDGLERHKTTVKHYVVT